jgi:hypothetical protein
VKPSQWINTLKYSQLTLWSILNTQQVTEMLVLNSDLICIIAQEDWNDRSGLFIQRTTWSLWQQNYMYQNIAKLEKYIKCSRWISLNMNTVVTEIHVPNLFEWHSFAYLIMLMQLLTWSEVNSSSRTIPGLSFSQEQLTTTEPQQFSNWLTDSLTHQPIQLTLTNCPAYNISARTAQKTLFHYCCATVAMETCLFAKPLT